MTHETWLSLLLCSGSSSEKAPRHWPLDSLATLKSSGEIDQLWPPKERATLTVVEQAEGKVSPSNKLEVKRVRTVGVISLVIASESGGTGNLSEELTDLRGGSAN